MKKSFSYEERSNFTDTSVGTYLPLGAVLVQEGGHSGPAGQENVLAALRYCSKCISLDKADPPQSKYRFTRYSSFTGRMEFLCPPFRKRNNWLAKLIPAGPPFVAGSRYLRVSHREEFMRSNQMVRNLSPRDQAAIEEGSSSAGGKAKTMKALEDIKQPVKEVKQGSAKGKAKAGGSKAVKPTDEKSLWAAATKLRGRINDVLTSSAQLVTVVQQSNAGLKDTAVPVPCSCFVVFVSSPFRVFRFRFAAGVFFRVACQDTVYVSELKDGIASFQAKINTFPFAGALLSGSGNIKPAGGMKELTDFLELATDVGQLESTRDRLRKVDAASRG